MLYLTNARLEGIRQYLMISRKKKTLVITLYGQQISSVGYQIQVRKIELGISVHLARNVR